MTIDPSHPTEPFLRAIDIHTLLPQREPMVMVGRLTAIDGRDTVTETTVTDGGLFVDGGRLSTAGIMENIAQTCAARIGYVNKYILRRGVQVGVIAAVRRLRVSVHPRVGQTLVTRVSVVEQVLGMTLAEATVAVDGQTVATTQMKLAVRVGDGHPAAARRS